MLKSRLHGMWTLGSRWKNCGAGHDAGIEENRRDRQKNVFLVTSAGPDTHEDAPYLGGEAFIRPIA